MEYRHETVLLQPTVAALVKNPDGIYVDCTVGGGGHAAAVARLLSAAAILIGIDQDPAALVAAKERIGVPACRVELIRDNFRNLRSILRRLSIPEVDGILMDLGASSVHFDNPSRGFSYMQDGPLDMRMDPAGPVLAADIVNKYSEDELTRVFFEFGEEKWARQIARRIVATRQEHRITRTGELVEIIKESIPAAARRHGPHPAKRVFQALRIEVNQELDALQQALQDAIDCLKPGGKICVITFHSLEDRIVKQLFRDLSKKCHCPPQTPICICGAKPKLQTAGKAIIPSPEEVERNPRSRSAKLRIAVRI